MRCVLALCVVLLAACSEQPADDLADALAAHPRRVHALGAPCAANPQAPGADPCRAAAEAFRRRFFSGQTGPDEYQTLADLPPIPPSFDEPDEGETAAMPAQEDAP